MYRPTYIIIMFSILHIYTYVYMTNIIHRPIAYTYIILHYVLYMYDIHIIYM